MYYAREIDEWLFIGTLRSRRRFIRRLFPLQPLSTTAVEQISESRRALVARFFFFPPAFVFFVGKNRSLYGRFSSTVPVVLSVRYKLLNKKLLPSFSQLSLDEDKLLFFLSSFFSGGHFAAGNFISHSDIPRFLRA